MTETSGRQTRREEVRTERRRRDDATLDGSQALKLAVPPEIERKLTEQGRVWRWANDEGNRIYRLTELDDWDKVEGVEPRDVVIDKTKGQTVKAYLLSKPQAFMDEDRHKKEVIRREAEKATMEGIVPGMPGGQPGPRPANTYADKANKIERGNQII